MTDAPTPARPSVSTVPATTDSVDLTPADLPPKLLAHAREFLASGQTPAIPKLAATILLLREAGSDREVIGEAVGDRDAAGDREAGAGGFEVHAIRRVSTMPFAPGMYAFPGGSVDPRDAGADVRWAGPDASWWASRLGQSADVAQAIVCAAVREVFEESGVLLAGATESTGEIGAGVVRDVSGDDWEEQRAALVARQLGFAEFLRARALVLRADLLAPWARWITPEFEPRRYDTYFFLARLPEGQLTRNVGGEADVTTWLRPVDRAGLPMLPPTRITLGQVAAYASIDAVMAAAAHRDAATPVVPRLVE